MGLPSVKDVQTLLIVSVKAMPVRMDPHPCTVRCWWTGIPRALGPGEQCTECGRGPMSRSPEELEALIRGKPELLVSVCESFLLMRKLLDHPAVMAAAHAAHAAHAKGKTNVL